ncbi:MAG: AAA family ATPase [Nitrososphaera sp.]|nr:AAA family ATPase [Nitrososphaera sp.]
MNENWLTQYTKWLTTWRERVRAQKEGRVTTKTLETLFTAAELTARPGLPIPFIVEDLYPHDGIGILSGDSGVGKSSFTRWRIKALIRKMPVAGRKVMIDDARILYLSLEEPNHAVIRGLLDVGLSKEELQRVYVIAGDTEFDEFRMLNPCLWLAAQIATHGINVTFIDTAIDFIQIDGLKEMEIVQEALVPLRTLAQMSNTYIELLFHPNRQGEEFGSVRIKGIVDTFQMLRGKEDNYRTLSAMRIHKGKVRRGKELLPSLLTKEGLWTKQDPDVEAILGQEEELKIIKLVQDRPWIKHRDLLTTLGGNWSASTKTLERLTHPAIRKLLRFGNSSRGFYYTTAENKKPPSNGVPSHIIAEWHLR